MNPIFSYDYLFPIISIFLILAIGGKGLFKGGIKHAQQYTFYKIDIYVFIFLAFYILNKYFLSAVSFVIADYFRILAISTFYIILRLFICGNEGRKKNLIVVFALLGIYEAFVALLQVVEGGTMVGSFGNRAVLANFFAAILPFLYWTLVTRVRSKGWSIITIPIALSIFLILYLVFFHSFSRTAILSILITSIVALCIEYKSLWTICFRKKNLPAFLFGIGCLCFILVTLLLSKKDSTNGRWFVICREIELLKQNFITGIGFGNFERVYNQYQAEYFSQHNIATEKYLASYINVNYNEILDFLLQGGLLGFVLLPIIAIKIFNLCRNADKNNLVFVYSIISLTILGTFSYPSETLVIVCVFIFSLSELGSLKNEQVRFITLPKPVVFLLVSGISIFIIAGILNRYNNILRWHVIKTKSASVESSNSDISNAYKDIAKKLSNDPVVLIDYGKYLMKNSQYTEAIGVLKEARMYSSNHTIFMSLGESYEKLGDHSLAIINYKYATFLIPNLFYPKYRLMNIYKNNGMDKDCLRTAMEIVRQPIKVESRVVLEIKSAAIDIQNMLQRKPKK